MTACPHRSFTAATAPAVSAIRLVADGDPAGYRELRVMDPYEARRALIWATWIAASAVGSLNRHGPCCGDRLLRELALDPAMRSTQPCLSCQEVER